MKNKMLAVAAATALAMTAGQVLAEDLNATAGPPSATASSSACDASAATDAAASVSATSGTGSDTHNAKVFSCNGVRIGTAISTTTGPSGTMLTVTPDANFLNGIGSFQVSAKGATTASNGEIKLAMTDTAVRSSIASAPADSGTLR